MKVTAVIPAFNEASVITGVIEGLRNCVDEIIVVDDGSRDATSACAEAAGAIVLRHIINRGQGAAEETGTRAALMRGADIVVHFDADGQHDPNDVAAMVAPIAANEVQVTLGSRFLGTTKNLPFLRRLVLKGGLVFMRLFSGLKLTDAQNGFRVFSRDAASRIHITYDGMAHASEILDQIADLELQYREVPVTIRYTKYSLAHASQGNSNALAIVWRLISGKFLS